MYNRNNGAYTGIRRCNYWSYDCRPAGIFMIDRYKKETALTDTKNTLLKEFPDIIVSNIITSSLQKNNIIKISLTGTEKPDDAKMKQTINEIMNKHKIISDINVHFFRGESVGK